MIFGENESKKRSTFTDPKVQQVFLNCIQFLTTSGLNQLFNKIDGVVEELLLNYPLGQQATVSDFENVFETAIQRVEKEAGSNNFADLIVPITNVHVSSYIKSDFNFDIVLDEIQRTRCHSSGRVVDSICYLNPTPELQETDESLRPSIHLQSCPGNLLIYFYVISNIFSS